MADSTTKCPLTKLGATFQQGGGDYREVDCPELDIRYRITGTAIALLEHLTPQERWRLVTWIIDQQRLGVLLPTIDSNLIEGVGLLPSLSVLDRVQRLYRYLQSRLSTLGDGLPWDVAMWSTDQDGVATKINRLRAKGWTGGYQDAELDSLVEYGVAQGYLLRSSQHLYLTVDGWRHLEELSRADGKSDQAFVAMWFGPDVASAYEQGIAPAIRDAGYVSMRIDQKEHANRIDDEIIAEIRRSRFVVADFTCGTVDDGGRAVAIPRGGVYYEAGFAQGLGIPVIWMCRQDHIDHVHFDTRQFNHITWTDASDLREKLKNRIGAVLGDGPHVAR